MYCIASSAASGSITSSVEPSMKTMECKRASSNGWMCSSGGMSGKTADPSAPSLSPACSSRRWSSGVCMSAPSDRGNDADFIAVLHRCRHGIQIANVLVVEVNVDEAPQLAIVEQLRNDGGILL